jgi:hypothetical protein
VANNDIHPFISKDEKKKKKKRKKEEREAEFHQVFLKTFLI